MKVLKAVWNGLWSVQGAISLWASIATIVAVILGVVGLVRVPKVEIKNSEDFAVAIVGALRYAEGENFKPDAELVRQVSQLDAVVRREFGVIEAGSKPFVMQEGDGLFLANGRGVKVPFAVSTIHTLHKYLYTGVNEERRQLYVGQSAVFDLGSSECKVTLMAIDEGRKEGSFYFQCEQSQ